MTVLRLTPILQYNLVLMSTLKKKHIVLLSGAEKFNKDFLHI